MRALVISLVFCLVTGGAIAKNGEIESGLVVVAEGMVRKAPDFALLNIGVVTTGKSSEEALASNRPAMNSISEIARRHGVDSADVHTSVFSLKPRFKQVANSPGQSQSSLKVPDGYEARTSLQITVRKLPSLGPLIDECVKSGSNEISNISFGLDDIETVRDEARRLAAQTAKARAKLYAEALGIELGGLISATDDAANAVSGVADLPSRRRSPGQAVSIIEPGEIVVSSSITTTWRIAAR